MPEKTLRSRILQYFPKQLMNDMSKIIYSNRFNDVNDKVHIMVELMEAYKLDFTELGTGTNRTAIFMDGFCFKIALDKYGVRDNEQEFILSKELQPYVIKVYETNGIIEVCEYVTLITKEEFIDLKIKITAILEDISNEYLLGDMGTINKNFCNWGRREDTNELVCLDFAYIYRIIGDEMFCPNCHVMLRYTPDYDRLVCPQCRRRYMFMDIRRKISQKMENEELRIDKEQAYHIQNPVQNVQVSKLDQEEDDDKPEKYTYRANLYDYILMKKYKEEAKMNEKYYETIVDIEDTYVDEEEDLESEIELMLKVQKGELPKSCLREETIQRAPQNEDEVDDLTEEELTNIAKKIKGVTTSAIGVAPIISPSPVPLPYYNPVKELTFEEMTTLDDQVSILACDSKESVYIHVTDTKFAAKLKDFKEALEEYLKEHEMKFEDIYLEIRCKLKDGKIEPSENEQEEQKPQETNLVEEVKNDINQALEKMNKERKSVMFEEYQELPDDAEIYVALETSSN